MLHFLVIFLIYIMSEIFNYKKVVKKRERDKKLEALRHFQPEDPIPRGVVDIESWKWDIEHFYIDVIIMWYIDGKYKKIIKRHPASANDWVIDGNAYEADWEKYKDGPRKPWGTPCKVSDNYNAHLYKFIRPQDENGNFLKEWPDQAEWEKIREEETKKLRELKRKKAQERIALLDEAIK